MVVGARSGFDRLLPVAFLVRRLRSPRARRDHDRVELRSPTGSDHAAGCNTRAGCGGLRTRSRPSLRLWFRHGTTRSRRTRGTMRANHRKAAPASAHRAFRGTATPRRDTRVIRLGARAKDHGGLLRGPSQSVRSAGSQATFVARSRSPARGHTARPPTEVVPVSRMRSPHRPRQQ